MSISGYIRTIGRGRDGARSLDRLQAHDLMCQVLDGRVSDLEVGAFAMAMRIKSESVAELAGFVDATHERCIALRSGRAAVVLPSYNGSRRLPNFTALLALLLARRGVDVLVHGPASDAKRVTTAEIFAELGVTAAESSADVEAAWARGEPAFMRTETLCPPLARLLAVRDVIGVRNSGHTVAKLLPALAGDLTLRVVNHTHPEYGVLLADFLAATASSALLMRGTEGEPVADARRLHKLDVFIDGVHRPDLSLPAQQGVLAEMAVLPAGNQASATASTIQAVLDGGLPAPGPIAAQVDCLLAALAAMGARSPLKEMPAAVAGRQ